MNVIRLPIEAGAVACVHLPAGTTITHLGIERGDRGPRPYAWGLLDAEQTETEPRYFAFLPGMSAGNLPAGTRIIGSVEVAAEPASTIIQLPDGVDPARGHTVQMFLLEIPARSEMARAVDAGIEEATRAERNGHVSGDGGTGEGDPPLQLKRSPGGGFHQRPTTEEDGTPGDGAPAEESGGTDDTE